MQDNNKGKNNIAISIVAALTSIMAIIIIALGDKILINLELHYPDWAFPAFFIPWFLIIISSLQKLSKNKKPHALQIWILKITIPVIIFTLPYFTSLLTKPANCLKNCLNISETPLSFEPYCMFIALIALFLLNFYSHHSLHNKN